MPITIPKHEPIKKIYVEMVRQIVESEAKNDEDSVLFIDEAYALNKKDANVDFGIEAINTILKYMEDHRGEIMIIFAGYTKEMEKFIKINPGLTSRVPNKFVFEDYIPDEIVEIGLLGLHNASYEVDEAAYTDLVKNNYRLTSDHSNGRWVRNLNEELIMVMSERVAHAQYGSDKIVADENGYAVPPANS